MDPLATPNDLDARNIIVPNEIDPDVLLASASSTVREAAGCPISEVTSTVTLVGNDWQTLTLPGNPVTAVSAVTVGGDTLTGWSLFDSDLTLPCGWSDQLPTLVTVTYTHGFPTVPDDIVDLVCSMVAIAVSGGYGTTERLQSFRLGDYSQTFTPTSGSDSPSPFGLPDSVRARLRARFGGGVAVL